MDRWQIALFVIAGYVAVMAMVRLMLRRREQVLDDLQQQVEDEQARRLATEKAAEKRKSA
ncbi:MAG: hypothetical protein ACOY3P_04365 [Planctomycetota bacterium]